MKSIVRLVLQGLGYGFLTLLGLVIVLLVSLQIGLNWEREAKIKQAVRDHYPGQNVEIGWTRKWGPHRQLCLYFRTAGSNGQSTQWRVARVQGDDDGGTWHFQGEHPNPAVCEASHSRG